MSNWPKMVFGWYQQSVTMLVKKKSLERTPDESKFETIKKKTSRWHFVFDSVQLITSIKIRNLHEIILSCYIHSCLGVLSRVRNIVLYDSRTQSLSFIGGDDRISCAYKTHIILHIYTHTCTGFSSSRAPPRHIFHRETGRQPRGRASGARGGTHIINI